MVQASVFPWLISLVASLSLSTLIYLTPKTVKERMSPYYISGTATGLLYKYSFYDAKEQSARWGNYSQFTSEGSETLTYKGYSLHKTPFKIKMLF